MEGSYTHPYLSVSETCQKLRLDRHPLYAPVIISLGVIPIYVCARDSGRDVYALERSRKVLWRNSAITSI